MSTSPVASSCAMTGIRSDFEKSGPFPAASDIDHLATVPQRRRYEQTHDVGVRSNVRRQRGWTKLAGTFDAGQWSDRRMTVAVELRWDVSTGRPASYFKWNLRTMRI